MDHEQPDFMQFVEIDHLFAEISELHDAVKFGISRFLQLFWMMLGFCDLDASL